MSLAARRHGLFALEQALPQIAGEIDRRVTFREPPRAVEHGVIEVVVASASSAAPPPLLVAPATISVPVPTATIPAG